jgi:NitT/TauT family transport system substrate-binding protein
LGIAVAQPGSTQDGFPPREIRPIAFRAWDPLCHGLTSGQLDAALINLPLAMDLFGAGLDIALVMFSHRGGSLIAGRPGLSKLAEFKGKSLLIPHRLSIQHMLMHKLMADQGIQLKIEAQASTHTVCAEAVPMHLMPQMIEYDTDKDIPGFICPDPVVSEAVAQERVTPVLTSQALWKDHPCCGLVARPPLLEDPDAMAYLVTTLFRAAALLDREISSAQGPGPDITSQAADFLQTSPQCAAHAMVRSGVTYCPGLLIPEKKPLITVQEYMIHTMGLLASPVDLDTFLRPEFAKNALGELGL